MAKDGERFDAKADAALVERTRAGDRSAFGELAGRYGRLVAVLAFQKVGNRADAEDIAQEALLRAFDALDELKDPARFGPWLYNIAFRLAVDHLRGRGRGGKTGAACVSLDALRDGARFEVAAPGAEGGAAEAVERKERSERVLAALGDLPEKYRLALTLRYMRGLSYGAIARHLDEPPGTIANRLFRAVRMLRERLGSLAPEPLGEPDERSRRT